MSEVEGVNPISKRLHIPRPERYWMATAGLFPGMVDPDIDDGRQRWPDRDDIRWDEIGLIITGVSLALADGSYDESQLLDDAVSVSISAPDGGLTLSETRILKSWFTFAEAPRGDLWVNDLVNGRHRLWNVWKHAPSAILPIRSGVLDYTDDVDSMGESFAATIRDNATMGLNKLPADVITRSPLYVAALAKAKTITAG